MYSTGGTPTPSSRDAGLRLRRRLTVGSAAGATIATAFFAAIGAMTIPGTTAAGAASVTTSTSSLVSPISIGTGTVTAAQTSTTTSATVAPAATQATPHAVTGGSG